MSMIAPYMSHTGSRGVTPSPTVTGSSKHNPSLRAPHRTRDSERGRNLEQNSFFLEIDRKIGRLRLSVTQRPINIRTLP
jgi:hypothetical protein